MTDLSAYVDRLLTPLRPDPDSGEWKRYRSEAMFDSLPPIADNPADPATMLPGSDDLEDVMSESNGFFMVWNPTRGVPKFRHPSRKSARAEAERLARQQAGEEFFVLKTVSVSRVQLVTITTKVAFDPAVAGPKPPAERAHPFRYFAWEWK